MVALAREQHGVPRGATRPRIRDHGRFWLVFVVLVLAGLLTAGVAFAAFGAMPAGMVLLTQGAVGLGLGIR